MGDIKPAQGPGDKYRTTGPVGKERSDAPSKAGRTQEVGRPGISRVTGDTDITRDIGQPSTKINGANPTLAIPEVSFKPEEFPVIAASVGEKIKEQVPFDTLKKRVSGGSEERKKQLNAAAQDIVDVLNSDKSFEYKTMRVHQILMATLGTSLEIGGEFGKILLNQQTETQKERTEEEKKAKEAEKGLKGASLAAQIFAVFADLINIISAVFTIIGASVATGATVGATSIVLAGAVMWLSGAIMGMAADANGFYPKDQQSDTLNASWYKGLQVACSLVGMIVTAGGSSYTAGIQSAAKAAVEAEMLAANTTINTGAKALLDAGEEIAKLNSAKITEALMAAAKQAESTTEALIVAVQAGGDIPSDIIINATKAAQALQAAVNAATLPQQIGAKAIQVFTEAVQAMTNAGIIEEILAQAKMIQYAHKVFQSTTSVFTTAGNVTTKIMTSKNQQEMLEREGEKIELDRVLSNLDFLQNNVLAKMTRDTVQALTDSGKAASATLKASSELGQKIAGNI